MELEFKNYVEKNFEYLVKLYNRYIRFFLKDVSDLEYYSSPYMNLTGYPSKKFLYFCAKYYNNKYNKNIIIKKSSKKNLKSIYHYSKLFFLFIFSPFFFSKKVLQKSVIIHGFHDDKNFALNEYTTIKSPPFKTFTSQRIYHDINISFISFKSLLYARQNNIICSLRYLKLKEFIRLHFIALKVYKKNKKMKWDKDKITYVEILYTLVKGVSIASLINAMDNETRYFNMWENRGYHHILDFLVKNSKKLYHLDLGIIFRLSPEYMMFYYLRILPKGHFLIMSRFNYDLVYKRFNILKYTFFKNYRLQCKENIYFNKIKQKRILLLAPLSNEVTRKLYNLICTYTNLDIKLKLHPYLQLNIVDTKYLENRPLHEIINDYDIIVYSGITTAAVELYFQRVQMYKFITNEFLDIDPLVDNGLVKKIRNLKDLESKVHKHTIKDKNYYLGCNNKTLEKILKG